MFFIKIKHVKKGFVRFRTKPNNLHHELMTAMQRFKKGEILAYYLIKPHIPPLV